MFITGVLFSLMIGIYVLLGILILVCSDVLIILSMLDTLSEFISATVARKVCIMSLLPPVVH